MPSSRILICGAGVAGSTLAYWLVRHDFQAVVVERSSAEQTAEQGTDIEGPAFEIVKLIGVLNKINEKRTDKEGYALVDKQCRPCGIFESDGFSRTRFIEIMRGDLTEILLQCCRRVRQCHVPIRDHSSELKTTTRQSHR